MVFALIGNQNCGKTTLFNRLTGSKQHVGNFPGVTVEKKEGIIKKADNSTVVDLPGIYSLSPYTSEEIVTRDFLIKDRPDAIINIVDATNIERNLYLTLQLLELKIPTIIALNMMDELTKSGGAINIRELGENLGVPVVPISAAKNEGITELIDVIVETATNKTAPKKVDFCSGDIHRAIHSMAHLIEDHGEALNMPKRYAATKLLEGDTLTIKELKLNKNEIDILNHIVKELETTTGLDREAALADMRYSFIERLSKQCVKKPQETKEQARSLKIDNIVTNKYLAIPIFIGIMGFIFYLTFGLVGPIFSNLVSFVIDLFTNWVDTSLTNFGLNEIIHSLIIDGIFAGVGSVLSFLPTIIVLFFFLSMLEDSGYMARIAFVMDKLLRKIGLSGKSFVPMLIGFGCSVPAIMATRTLSSNRDRRLTIMITPFMSCSAKLPIYAVFSLAFFPNNVALIMIILYVLGMLVSILSAFLLKNTLFKGNPIPFVMELPSYRFPSMKSTIIHMWEKAKDFIHKAFTVIFVATIVIWFLQNFDIRINPVEDSSKSILANIGNFIAPIFKPLGFSSWQASTALITGLTAKETVISTFAILLNVSESQELATVLSSIFTPLSAFSFLTFTLLYTPCIAALATIKKEMQSRKYTAFAIVFQLAVAWCTTFIVYNIGKIFF